MTNRADHPRLPDAVTVGLSLLRRFTGLALVALVLLPVYRLLQRPATGFAARKVGLAADAYYGPLWWESALLGLAGVALAYVAGPRLLDGASRLGAWLERPPSTVFAGAVAMLSALATLGVSLVVLHGQPVLLDGMVQLLHGRYLAAGHLAGPSPRPLEFWTMQFMVDTPHGWLSQYPPAYPLLLAAGHLAGAPWLVGAALMALTAGLACAVGERLLPKRLAVARLGALLTALSPFALGLAAAYMNHAAAAAFGLAAAYCALRGLTGARAWNLAAGAAIGALFLTRPLTALVIGSAVTLGCWVWMQERPSLAALIARVAALSAGAAPFGLLFGLYNARLFGSPLRFGYLAAAGPSHGLGFHLDPWGNPYTPVAALGYVSAELLALGRDLLGTPVPAVVVIGLFLAVTRRLSGGEKVLTAWALLPVLVNAFYWHHDLVLGPRLLGDAAPAWCLLAAVAASRLLAPPVGGAATRRGGLARSAATAALLLALALGLVYRGPARLVRVAEPMPQPVKAPPRPPGPALVFVHEKWVDRLGARLAARGLRLDAVRKILLEQDPCQVQNLLDGARPADSLGCRRQAESDRHGTLSLPPMLWQGDLPGGPVRGILWARDLGPQADRRLADRLADRTPLFLIPPLAGHPWRLVPLEEGLAILWGSEPADSPPDRQLTPRSEADTPG